MKTKEQILQEHFEKEFNFEGHGKFMEYILNSMQEYTDQEVEKVIEIYKFNNNNEN